MYARLFARCALAGGTATSLLFVGCSPASAETVSEGQVGTHTAVTCGWYPQDESLFDLAPRKRVRINLPAVSGVTDDQLIYAQVRFLQPDGEGGLAQYRSGWFYTYASPGQLTSTWTSYSSGATGLTYVEDEGAESGYASGDAQNPTTIGEVDMYWMDGWTTSGDVSEAAVNATNAQYPEICNGGGTLF